MSPQELANLCAERINWRTLNGLDPKEAAILVTTPKGWKAPPRWPSGEIVRWQEDGSRVRYFPAMPLLAWLVGHGLAKVDMRVVPGPSD